MEPLLQLSDVGKRFGGFVALQDITLDIFPGSRVGLIGPNGSGKTTLMNCVSGSTRTSVGEIFFGKKEITKIAAFERAQLGICRTFQIPRPFMSLTAFENVLLSVCHNPKYKKRRRDPANRKKAAEVLEFVGLGRKGGEVQLEEFTQVDLRRLELARAIALGPQLLICDESMAGLSIQEVDQIVDLLLELNKRGIAIIMIEHLMSAIQRFAEDVICLDAGRVLRRGSPEEVLSDHEVERIYFGKM